MKEMQGARLVLRLSKQKKTFFEEVAGLGGFTSLYGTGLYAVGEENSDWMR